MKSKYLSVLAMFCGLALGAQLGASQSTAFDYKGSLSDNNLPGNANYDLNFVLFDAATGGSAIGPTITTNNLAVASGTFTVSLDFGLNAFDGSARWIEIGLRPGGTTGAFTTLTPRQSVPTMPYAVFATSAGSVPNNSITAPKLGSGAAVKTLNGLTDAVSLVAGANITLTPLASTITISATGGGPGGWWGLTGNAGTTPGVNFIGTTDNQPLELRAPGVSIGTTATFGHKLNVQLDEGTAAGLHNGAARIGNVTFGYVSDGNQRTSALIASADNLPLTIGPLTAAGGVFIDLNGGVGIGIGTTSLSNYRLIVAHEQGVSAGQQLTARIDNVTFGYEADGVQRTAGLIATGEGLPLTLGNFGIAGGFRRGLTMLDGNVGIGTTTPQARLDVAGLTRTCVLSITGGCDLAEPFQIATPDIAKGSIVVIDEENPGQLKLSDNAYDQHVAGIISGANGIQSGITLSQKGMAESGQNVALTGRVYALAEAANGPIRPGDLLTTSPVAGHAMKVTDHARAQGAILGKAMTPLATGRGMVLVLVTLQ